MLVALSQLVVALASGGSVLGWLAFALSDMGEASHRSHPCSPLATKTLPRKPTTYLCHEVIALQKTSGLLVPCCLIP